MPDAIRLISGTANPAFTQSIFEHLQEQSVDSKIVDAEIGHFSDGETRVQIKDTVRGYRLYVVQPTCPPVNDNLMELCAILDALKRASAATITAVVPYYGYSRQERKGMPRVPINAKMVARFIEIAGAHRVVAMDFHAPAIQGFFEIPVDNLYAYPVLAENLKKSLSGQDTVIVSPDIGGTSRARMLAEYIGAELAIIEKRRSEDSGDIKLFKVIGDVDGKKAILCDDIVASGKSLIRAADLLDQAGASEVWAAATHGVLCGNAVQDIDESRIKSIVITDTIAPKQEEGPKFFRASVAGVFADTIRRIHENRSVSDIFNHKY
ncbi:ribose-phosphate pyrophosphokinase [Patescibacteria group bacterium]|nr:ribose-phosphate pyrophosphokinase [Patescibacteria group bacterium]MBU4023478.1 ribose-phosphate pyrophosphokinase [Patescibacteria group bacterium]MBU4078417.1 ribose-phosphate pyrophosphokinase [Patescibacteria group bacterium]